MHAFAPCASEWPLGAYSAPHRALLCRAGPLNLMSRPPKLFFRPFPSPLG